MISNSILQPSPLPRGRNQPYSRQASSAAVARGHQLPRSLPRPIVIDSVSFIAFTLAFFAALADVNSVKLGALHTIAQRSAQHPSMSSVWRTLKMSPKNFASRTPLRPTPPLAFSSSARTR